MLRGMSYSSDMRRAIGPAQDGRKATIMQTTRTAAEVSAEIKRIQAADRAHNRTMNEGGQGYERSTVPESLFAELAAAENAEFMAVWTSEVLAERRAAWNAGVQQLTAKHGRAIPAAAVAALESRLGYRVGDIARAKRLHGIA